MPTTDPAELIRQCRLSAGLTQQQLAIRAGTTKTAISRLEAGHVSPTIETLSRLLLCLGRQLDMAAAPLTTRTDVTQLDGVADLMPAERLDHALASQASLTGLLGAARVQ